MPVSKQSANVHDQTELGIPSYELFINLFGKFSFVRINKIDKIQQTIHFYFSASSIKILFLKIIHKNKN